jgi:hypothetical protein
LALIDSASHDHLLDGSTDRAYALWGIKCIRSICGNGRSLGRNRILWGHLRAFIHR